MYFKTSHKRFTSCVILSCHVTLIYKTQLRCVYFYEVYHPHPGLPFPDCCKDPHLKIRPEFQSFVTGLSSIPK